MSAPKFDAALTTRPCPFITFYSFKGGVGRSMAVINVAGIMAARGFRVMVVDVDLEAPGLSFLTNPTTRDGEADHAQLGFVDVLLDAVQRGADSDLLQLDAAEVVGRYAAPYELPEGFRRTDGGSLHIMPAGRLDLDYPARLDSLNLPLLYSEGTGLALIKAFKQVVQESRQFDYVLIDSRTGFSDESGICTRDLADCLMVVSGLNKQNVEGTSRFLAALRRVTDERKPLEVILSPIPNGEDALVDQRETQARAAFSEAWGTTVRTDLHIPYHPQLALTEEPHIFRRRRGYLFDAYVKIERRLLSLVGEVLDTALNSAIAALEKKKYAVAEDAFRRASKLADTQDWADRAAYLVGSSALVVDPGAQSVFNFVIEQASSTARKALAWRLVDDADSRGEKEPGIAKVLYERALGLDPNNSRNLALYGSHTWTEENDLDGAQELYKRALEADSSDMFGLRSYAHFLCHGRNDLDGAEVLYKRALETNPNDVDALVDYGTFLWNQRKDPDGAEALYKRALETNPNDIDALVDYATFLWNQRKDPDGAEVLYKRALETNPNDIDALGGYANFLWNERKDPDGVEALYKRALETNPNDIDALGGYATFLWNERKDLDGIEALYKRALETNPNDIDALGDYASFLWNERKDLDGAEALYKRALETHSGVADAATLENYASFLWMERKNANAAETMYRRALAITPYDTNILGNYGCFCLTLGRVTEGMDLVYRALKNLDEADSLEGIHAECWMYIFCCGEPGSRPEALRQLRALVEVHSVCTEDWDFAGVIHHACTMGHPEQAWLPILADVLGGRQPPVALIDWPAWREAAVIPKPDVTPIN